VDPHDYIACCDATEEAQVEALFQEHVPRILGGSELDALVHSIAYAPASAMKHSKGLVHLNMQDFNTAHEASSFSLLSLMKHGLPLMSTNSSVVALSYLGIYIYIYITISYIPFLSLSLTHHLT